MSKEPGERTHRQKTEAKKQDGYLTRYEDVNQIHFSEGWTMAVRLDPGLPKQTYLSNLSTNNKEDRDTTIALQRAIATLARRVAELEKEWS